MPNPATTPWLTAAIAENFGNQFRVEIGATVLERDEHGRTAMRIHDVTVRDRDGTVIASAPKAEVGFSSSSLLGGHPRAESLSLVGAELAVRDLDVGPLHHDVRGVDLDRNGRGNQMKA